MLEKHTAFRVTGEPKVERLFEDPDQAGENIEQQLGLKTGPVDAIIDTAVPTVYPTNARLRRVSAGSVGVLNSLPFERFSQSLREGLNVAPTVNLTPRLDTALVLYNAHHYEASGTARLVTLVMGLEVLAESREKHPAALAILDRWQEDLASQLEEAKDPDVVFSLESLQRELLFRREDSLRGRVRRLALDAFDSEPEETRAAYARRVVDVYDLRSTLVHDGSLPPSTLAEACIEARDLVAAIIKERLVNPRPTEGIDSPY
jgi:hypothetical protein